VAKGKLLNQNNTIPSTTIFTPTQTGLYRLSIYATVVKPDPSSQSSWNVDVSWTDDAGPQGQTVLYGLDFLASAFYPDNAPTGLGGPAMVVEARAGQPIAYSVTQPEGPDNSAYSLYYTLERLE